MFEEYHWLCPIFIWCHFFLWSLRAKDPSLSLSHYIPTLVLFLPYCDLISCANPEPLDEHCVTMDANSFVYKLNCFF